MYNVILQYPVCFLKLPLLEMWMSPGLGRVENLSQMVV